jgi:glucan phosphorylase
MKKTTHTTVTAADDVHRLQAINELFMHIQKNMREIETISMKNTREERQRVNATRGVHSMFLVEASAVAPNKDRVTQHWTAQTGDI